jgi:hypothetical protein
VALFVPDFVAETFQPGTGHGGHDGADRSIRYLEWTWDPDPSDTTYISDMAYLLREGDGVSVAHDRHVLGVFPTEMWLRVLQESGFETRMVTAGLADGEMLHMFVGVLRR